MQQLVSEMAASSGVLPDCRILERLEWVPVGHTLDPMLSAKETVNQWRLELETANQEVLWSRCIIKKQRQDLLGEVWASVWMIAGIGTQE